jgi:hypothetical protein
MIGAIAMAFAILWACGSAGAAEPGPEAPRAELVEAG